MPKTLRVALPLVLIALGILSLIASGRSLIGAFRQDGTLFRGPGESTVQVPKPGSYTLWIQNRGTIDGRLLTMPTDLPSGAVIEVTRAENGESIPLDGNVAATITFNGTVRKAVGSLDIQQPGKVKITVEELESPRLFYLSESFSFKGVFGAMSLLFTGGCLLLAGIGIGIYFLLRPAPREYHTLQPPR